MSEFLQRFAMHHEICGPAIQTDGYWRKHPDGRFVETLTAREMDEHLRSEGLNIRRFAEPATHSAKILLAREIFKKQHSRHAKVFGRSEVGQ